MSYFSVNVIKDHDPKQVKEETACFGSWLPRSGVHNMREGKACWLITFPYRKCGGVNKWEKRGQEPTNPTPEPHPRDMLPPAKLYLLKVPPSPPKVQPAGNQVCGGSISHWNGHARQPGPWERRLATAFSTLLQPVPSICSCRSFLSWILCLSFFKSFSLQFRFTFEVCLVIYAFSNIVWVYWEIM